MNFILGNKEFEIKSYIPERRIVQVLVFKREKTRYGIKRILRMDNNGEPKLWEYRTEDDGSLHLIHGKYENIVTFPKCLEINWEEIYVELIIPATRLLSYCTK